MGVGNLLSMGNYCNTRTFTLMLTHTQLHMYMNMLYQGICLFVKCILQNISMIIIIINCVRAQVLAYWITGCNNVLQDMAYWNLEFFRLMILQLWIVMVSYQCTNMYNLLGMYCRTRVTIIILCLLSLNMSLQDLAILIVRCESIMRENLQPVSRRKLSILSGMSVLRHSFLSQERSQKQ